MNTANIIIRTGSFILIALITIVNTAISQVSKKDAIKTTVSKNLVDSRNFVFIPQSVSPLRGGTRYITSYYDLEISNDTITAFLPYFGQAHTAPINADDAGINFTSTNFEYKVTPAKKGAWGILIKLKADPNVRELSLQVFDNSTASLNVINQNRDPVSYRGYITEKKQKK